MEPSGSGHCKDRDQNQNRKFQHGDHIAPPDLHTRESHARNQSHFVDG
jgi:hypothetical protein